MFTARQLSDYELMVLDNLLIRLSGAVAGIRETLPGDDYDVSSGIADLEQGIEKLSSFHQRQGQQ